MNELLQEHGCSNVFTIPEGLKELMADISREVLRDQPVKIYDYIANYLSVLLITREHGILAVKILDDLCDCKPTVSEHLLQLGLENDQAQDLAQIIKDDIEGFAPLEGKETLKESQILQKILKIIVLDEEKTGNVLQVVRNAYRDYWYRKKLLEKNLKMQPDEPWEIAAERTLNIYKRTKPSFNELNRATKKIQAAYRGYHVRRNILHHLKHRKPGPKEDLQGPPLDIAGSREIDLGPVVDLKVREENTKHMFDEVSGKKLGVQYDPMKTVTHERLSDSKTPRAFRFAGFAEDEEPQDHTCPGKSVGHAAADADTVVVTDHDERPPKSSGPKFSIQDEEEHHKSSTTKFSAAPVSIAEDVAEIPEELPEDFEGPDDQDIPEEISQDVPQFLDDDDDFADDFGEDDMGISTSAPSSAHNVAEDKEDEE